MSRNFALDQITGPHSDFVVIVNIKDHAAIDAYKAHPLYAKSICRVRSVRKIRVAAELMTKEPL